MRNINDGYALFNQIGDNRKELIELVPRQNRRGFVHDDEVSILGKRFGNFDELLLGDCELADGQARMILQ